MRFVVVVGLGLACAGCQGPAADSTPGAAAKTQAAAPKAPIKATRPDRPGTGPVGPARPAKAMRTVKVDAAAAARGKTAYAACVGCHGERAEGRVGMAPRLASKSFLAAASDEMLAKTIREGRAGTTMVPWASLGEEKISDIIAFLRSLAPSEPVTLDEKAVAGNQGEGEKLFQQICATCHGRSGGGYLETGNGTGIGRRAFLGSVTDGFLRYIIRHGKDQTQMRPFDRKAPTAVANLKDTEIESVIAYMRANAW